MTSYRYLGYGTTDSNGVAHLKKNAKDQDIDGYTGVGAGEIDIIASLDKPIVDGSIVSKTLSVLDCMFLDSGTTGTVYSGWIGANSTNSSADSDGTTFYETQGSYQNFRANKTGTSTSDPNDYTGATVVEFEVVSMSATGCFIQHNGGTGKNITRTATQLGITDGNKVKCVYDGSTIKYYVNDVEKTSARATVDLGTYLIGFVCNNGNVKFKNYKIYPI